MTDRRTGRWFGHPLIVLGLLVLLLVDLRSIPADNGRHSTIQRAILGDPRGAAVHGRQLPGAVLRTDAGIEWVWAWDDQYGRPHEHGEVLHTTVFRHLTRREGLYHLTRERERLTIFDSAATPLTPAEVAALPAIVVRAIDASVDTEATSQAIFACERHLLTAGVAVGGGEYVIDSRLTTGYIRNGIAASVLTLLLGGFLLGRTWRWIPIPSPAEARRHKRMQRGQCLFCGYDLGGLPGAPACPECGERRVYCS